MSKHNIVCAGIDTGKRKLDAALNGGKETLQVDNTAEGHALLLAWLRKHRVKRVGIEASGGYEQDVVTALRKCRVAVIVFQPSQVRAYARFHLKRAKNDRIDAALIAACAAATSKVHAAPDPRLAPFARHLTFIEQLEQDIVCIKNRCETCRDPRQLAFWKSEIARLKKLVRSELQMLVRDIRQHPDLAQRLDLIASVDTVGLPTAVSILVRMPEIGQLSREQAAALAGLAPYDDDSGEQAAPRHIEGGRQRLRKALYSAAFAGAFHWNPQLQTIYRRLIRNGKPHKVALIACARKLLIYVNTVVARGTPWLAQAAAH